VSEAVASSLLTEKTSVSYPDAARNAGIQGIVVLKVTVGETGEVKNVTVDSGDPLLAQAAVDAVKQWKYKPYTVDGSPVQMETLVTLNFHFSAPEHVTPPLGSFMNGTYRNEFFDINYPLSHDWVRETGIVQKRLSETGRPPGSYVLLAAVHIPQKTDTFEIDSSFVLSVVERANRNCEQYVQAIANELQSQKVAQQKGATARFAVPGHDYYRADFEFREPPTYRALVCTQTRDHILQWNIVAKSKGGVETAFSTLSSIGATNSQTVATENATTDSALQPGAPSKAKPTRVRVAQGITTTLLIKKVQPVYPPQARFAHIQGSVILSAVIDKNGDVGDLELLEGPMGLAVSAVIAVRQWKYRPYLLNGEPVEVLTQITVNYTLSDRFQ
jgi:protein TonB